jgi:hypothetical protein
MYGKEAYQNGLRSSRIYGLAGETLLNFGPLLIPIAFLVLGLAVSYVRNIAELLDSHDSRSLLLPLLINLCFIILINDSDNMVVFLAKNGFVPFLIIFFASVRLYTKHNKQLA